MSYYCVPCERRFNKIKTLIAHDDAMHRDADHDGPRRFQIGHTYEARSFADYDCIFRFTVVKRTEQTIIVNYLGRLYRKKVWTSTRDGVPTEVAKPLEGVLIYATREEA